MTRLNCVSQISLVDKSGNTEFVDCGLLGDEDGGIRQSLGGATVGQMPSIFEMLYMMNNAIITRSC